MGRVAAPPDVEISIFKRLPDIDEVNTLSCIKTGLQFFNRYILHNLYCGDWVVESVVGFDVPSVTLIICPLLILTG